MTTYARLGTVNLPECRDLTDFWQHPTSSFISQGACAVRRRTPRALWRGAARVITIV